MSGNQAPRGWPLRIFRVDGESMRPTLGPGEWLVGFRDGRDPKRDQIRVFRDPSKSTRWLVKRVGDVHPSSHGAVFEARSDNPRARYASDSHDFGPVRAQGSYRVVWRFGGRQAR